MPRSMKKVKVNFRIECIKGLTPSVRLATRLVMIEGFPLPTEDCAS